jgi:hypothetical protein
MKQENSQISKAIVKLEDGSEIELDTHPLTVDDFEKRLLAMLQDHVEWGKQVFPFILANK